MADAWLEFNSDFAVSATGGLLLAYGPDLARQRIIRRLMTAVRGYIFDLSYGAGLPQRIGRPARASTIQSIVMSQIVNEKTVAPEPAPKVRVTESQSNLGAFIIEINYTDALGGDPVSLTFSTSN
jgi:hypothetical protein